MAGNYLFQLLNVLHHGGIKFTFCFSNNYGIQNVTGLKWNIKGIHVHVCRLNECNEHLLSFVVNMDKCPIYLCTSVIILPSSVNTKDRKSYKFWNVEDRKIDVQSRLYEDDVCLINIWLSIKNNLYHLSLIHLNITSNLTCK